MVAVVVVLLLVIITAEVCQYFVNLPVDVSFQDLKVEMLAQKQRQSGRNFISTILIKNRDQGIEV
jgi:hypothetical protein